MGETAERPLLLEGRKRAMLCRGCLEQLRLPIFLRGPLAIPYRMFGLRPSRMNPNLCTLCETRFQSVYQATQIQVPLTILFADVRGYTSFSQLIDSPEVARVLTGFYELCGEIVWEREGLVNKLIGDAVLAVFNFPLVREDHVQRAVEAGVEIQRQLRRAALHLRGPEGVEHPVGIGVGIHSGRVSIGEVGKFCRDFTVIGPVVNLASRLQGAAGAGEVVVSEEVYRLVAEKFPDARARVATVKGFEKPVNTFVLSA